jgi:hypothetical protein
LCALGDRRVYGYGYAVIERGEMSGGKRQHTLVRGPSSCLSTRGEERRREGEDEGIGRKEKSGRKEGGGRYKGGEERLERKGKGRRREEGHRVGGMEIREERVQSCSLLCR